MYLNYRSVQLLTSQKFIIIIWHECDFDRIVKYHFQASITQINRLHSQLISCLKRRRYWKFPLCCPFNFLWFPLSLSVSTSNGLHNSRLLECHVLWTGKLLPTWRKIYLLCQAVQEATRMCLIHYTWHAPLGLDPQSHRKDSDVCVCVCACTTNSVNRNFTIRPGTCQIYDKHCWIATRA
jgi:hypothetical protein